MRQHTIIIRIMFVLLFLLFPGLTFSQNTGIAHLKTDLQSTPIGYDHQVPEFSWILQSAERGTAQTAYEILVSNDQKKLETGTGDNWRSGKVSGNATFGIKYQGKLLQQFTFLHFPGNRSWKVASLQQLLLV